MEKHKCKLCLRSFSNGRALGGHMRSHIESETESSKNPTRKRSKRTRSLDQSFHHQYHHQRIEEEAEAMKKQLKFKYKAVDADQSSWAEPEPVSSISDTTTEEHKTFRSYQALGGHRASHKKIKLNSSTTTPANNYEPKLGHQNVGTPEKKVHECPVCFRVFSSGQALGGHKRTHVTGSTSTPTSARASTKLGQALIDLNLPAPMDDDDISQIEHSAVSDAEFVNPIRR
ncbi:zinc finger protein zat9 [Quercus suber]|uniref:Zinc finger protein zat9 n=1 Tax=Quercus suber TaxID=58331 RepID=A0AAW0LGZ5_QUESU